VDEHYRRGTIYIKTNKGLAGTENSGYMEHKNKESTGGKKV
jgi:hypothetical protein